MISKGHEPPIQLEIQSRQVVRAEERIKAKEEAFYTQYQNTMNYFEDTTLTEEQLLSKKILLWECTQYLEGMAFKKELMPIDQMWGFQLLFGQLASGVSAQPFVTVEDYENWWYVWKAIWSGCNLRKTT